MDPLESAFGEIVSRRRRCSISWPGESGALGLSLKPEKTAVTHIDEGFLFLGQLIVRRPKGKKRHVCTFDS
jgi:hypothetical protein